QRVDLSPELEDLLTRCLGQVTRTYRYAKGPRESFKAILTRKGETGRVLRMMHRVDFLGRYIPEFGQLTCLVQQIFFAEPAQFIYQAVFEHGLEARGDAGVELGAV